MRKCGLKCRSGSAKESDHTVTSLAEVWIEISLQKRKSRSSSLSLPLRKCGLKFTSFAFKAKIIRSLPLRKCGLKYQSYLIMMQLLPSLPLRKCGLKYRVEWRAISGNPVTSLAEVWIEICMPCHRGGGRESLPLRKCGLKLL